ncbi:unnamed protein product, partial [Closterium sp. Naga37s-1]
VEAVYVHRTDKPSTGGVDLSTDEMYPAHVEAVYVHRTDKPSTGGVDLSTDEMYFAHVRSINGKGIACRPPKDQENDLQADDRERCTLVAETAARARECAQDGFSNQVGWDG